MDELIKYTNYSKLKYNTKIKYFLYVSISILIILCVMIHNVVIPNYYYNKAIITKLNEENCLKLLVLENEAQKIINNKEFIINNKKYKYKVKYISDIIVDNNYNSYFEIYLDSVFNREKENSVYEVKIKNDEKLLNKVIYNFVIGR